MVPNGDSQLCESGLKPLAGPCAAGLLLHVSIVAKQHREVDID